MSCPSALLFNILLSYQGQLRAVGSCCFMSLHRAQYRALQIVNALHRCVYTYPAYIPATVLSLRLFFGSWETGQHPRNLCLSEQSRLASSWFWNVCNDTHLHVQNWNPNVAAYASIMSWQNDMNMTNLPQALYAQEWAENFDNIAEQVDNASKENTINVHDVYNMWVFPKIGVPQSGWFIMEKPIKMNDLGVPLFSETSMSTRTQFIPLLPFILHHFTTCTPRHVSMSIKHAHLIYDCRSLHHDPI